jgi:hypothetical protein
MRTPPKKKRSRISVLSQHRFTWKVPYLGWRDEDGRQMTRKKLDPSLSKPPKPPKEEQEQ